MPCVREGRPSHPRSPGGTQRGQNGLQAASSLSHLWTQSVWGLQWQRRPGRSLQPQTLPAVEKAEASCTPRPLLRLSLGALQLWAPTPHGEELSPPPGVRLPSQVRHHLTGSTWAGIWTFPAKGARVPGCFSRSGGRLNQPLARVSWARCQAN